MIFLYNLLFPILFVLYLPAFLSKLVRRGGGSRDFLERFGLFTTHKKRILQDLERPVWVHAVSVGEAVAACSFIREWHARNPNLQFVLSTTTTTGHAIAEKKLAPNTTLIYCPLDFYPFVRRALSLMKPRLLVIFEVEIWPNLVCLTAARDIPVTLVNARMSDKSARGYARHRWLFEPIFSRFTLFCTQSEADSERIRRVVGDNVPVYACNTMKFDQTPAPGESPDPAILERVFGDGKRIVWVAASTHPGEESLVARVYKTVAAAIPELKLILVPRHHERTPEVEKILREQSLADLKWTDFKAAGQCSNPQNCLLVNTTGELMKFMAMADFVYMGKTMAGNTGGHNIIEPALLGKAVVHGPHMENFRLVLQAFAQQKAVWQVENEAELTEAVRRLSMDSEHRRELGNAARRVVEECRGAIPKTLDLMAPLI